MNNRDQVSPGRRRLSPMIRNYLRSSHPVLPEVVRPMHKCPDCMTWVFGVSPSEVERRLSEHRGRRHG